MGRLNGNFTQNLISLKLVIRPQIPVFCVNTVLVSEVLSIKSLAACGAVHTCATPGADKLPPPLSSVLRDPLSFQRSHLLTAHDRSLTITKKNPPQTTLYCADVGRAPAGHREYQFVQP